MPQSLFASRKLRYTLTVLACIAAASIHAQDQRRLIDHLYLDISAGLFVYDIDAGLINHQALGAVGYRLSPHHAVGASWRGAGFTGSYNREGFSGIGLDYRLSLPQRLIVKVGGGLAISGSEGSDSSEATYLGGGRYGALTLDYRLRSGFTLGGWVTGVRGTRFDNYNWDWSVDDFVYSGEVEEQLVVAGIQLGWAWSRHIW